MTAAHTPGPWTFSTSPEGWSHTIHVSQADGAPYTEGYSDVGYIIQTCRGEEESTQTANARLIAAAPELLEALRDMLDGWKYIRNSHGDLYGVGWDRAQVKAEAAIAKATGA